MSKNVIAIVGPKGGVGKSTISSNLAIALADMDRKVTAVDLDLGGANLHILLGVKEFKHSLDDFILKKVKNLEEVCIATAIERLQLICGGSKIPDIANMPFQQKMKLINHILRLEGDTVILDLAAGSSFNVIDFLMIANQQLMVTTPEMPSLLKVYSFIKACVFRLLIFHFKSTQSAGILDIFEQAKDTEENPHLKTVSEILLEAERLDAAAVESAREVLNMFRPNIVINMVQEEKESNVGNVVQSMLQQYLSVNAGSTTTLPADTMVRKALFRNKPMMFLYPESDFSRAIRRLAKKCY